MCSCTCLRVCVVRVHVLLDVCVCAQHISELVPLSVKNVSPACNCHLTTYAYKSNGQGCSYAIEEVHTHALTLIHTNTNTHTYTFTHTQIHLHSDTQIHTRALTRIHTNTHTYTHRPVTLINTHNHTPGYSSQRHTHFATLASKELEMTVMCSSGVPAQCGSICACEQVRACARVCVCVRLPNAKACVLACEQVRACEEIRACVSVCWCVHACVFSLSYVALMDVPVPVCECKMRWCVWKLCARHTP